MLTSLRNFLRQPVTPRGCVHALYLLHGLQVLKPQDVLDVFSHHAHPRVLEHALRMCESFPADAEVHQAVAGLKSDNPRVQLQRAFTIGAFPAEFRLRTLPGMLQSTPADPLLHMACLTSAHGIESAVAREMLADSQLLQNSASVTALGELLKSVESSERKQIMNRLIATTTQDNSLQVAEIVVDLVSTIPKVRNDLTDHQHQVRDWLQAAQGIIRTGTDSTTRANTVQILRLGEFAKLRDIFEELLSSHESSAVQKAALETLTTYADTAVADLLTKRWNAMSPAMRQEAERVMSSRTNWTLQFLAAVNARSIARGNINYAQIRRWAQSRNSKISTSARSILADATLTSRSDVVKRYEAAFDLVGDAGRGAVVFKKNCAGCHRLGNGFNTRCAQGRAGSANRTTGSAESRSSSQT